MIATTGVIGPVTRTTDFELTNFQHDDVRVWVPDFALRILIIQVNLPYSTPLQIEYLRALRGEAALVRCVVVV